MKPDFENEKEEINLWTRIIIISWRFGEKTSFHLTTFINSFSNEIEALRVLFSDLGVELVRKEMNELTAIIIKIITENGYIKK